MSIFPLMACFCIPYLHDQVLRWSPEGMVRISELERLVVLKLSTGSGSGVCGRATSHKTNVFQLSEKLKFASLLGVDPQRTKAISTVLTARGERETSDFVLRAVFLHLSRLGICEHDNLRTRCFRQSINLLSARSTRRCCPDTFRRWTSLTEACFRLLPMPLSTLPGRSGWTLPRPRWQTTHRQRLFSLQSPPDSSTLARKLHRTPTPRGSSIPLGMGRHTLRLPYLRRRSGRRDTQVLRRLPLEHHYLRRTSMSLKDSTSPRGKVLSTSAR